MVAISMVMVMVMSPSDGFLERVDGGAGQQTDRYGPFCIKGRLDRYVALDVLKRTSFMGESF